MFKKICSRKYLSVFYNTNNKFYVIKFIIFKEKYFKVNIRDVLLTPTKTIDKIIVHT